MEGQEQNKTEEPTPFKLRKAREKGQVARGMDLGFLGSLLAFAVFMLLFGDAFVQRLALVFKRTLIIGIDHAHSPAQSLALTGEAFWTALQPLLVLGGIIVVLLIVLELLQLKGFIFTAAPLKPDFSRINPAKGLKRLFSLKMLKEALKNILKMAAYSLALGLVIIAAMEDYGASLVNDTSLAAGMVGSAKMLLFIFIAIAAFFVVIDQIIIRKEFHKQMRMSHRELQREVRDREGEPRQKQQRRKLHGEMAKQAKGLGPLEGADFLVTNPEHFAVALRYEAGKQVAPVVQAKGRDHFAQILKRRAYYLAIPTYRDPPLARALYDACERDQPIRPEHYEQVAQLYRNHYRQRSEVENRVAG